MMGVVKCAAWLAVLLLAIVSLVPGQYRPHVVAYGGLEHAVAYAAASVILALAHSSRWKALIGLCMLAGLLEVLQDFAHGRHPQLSDFVASCLGAVAGSLIALIVLRYMKASARQRVGREPKPRTT